MDVHKPKSWHGLREFGKELLTIVLGVLIALAAEATVEEFRWAQRIDQTEDHLRQRVRGITVSVAARQALQPCIDQMFDKLQLSLETSGDDWRPPFVITGRPKGIVAAPKGGWSAEEWNAALADGTVNHLPKKELLAFSNFFAVAANVRRFNEQETGDIAELNSLASIHRLDPTTRAQYLRLLYRVRQNQAGIGIQGEVVMNSARRLGVKPATAASYTPAAMAYYQDICRQFSAGKTEINVSAMQGRGSR
jgi:hypothetical protein